MKFPSLLLLLLAATLAARPAFGQAEKTAVAPAAPSEGGLKTATFAGGCFWCMQYPFDRVKGVKKTVVGYTGGKTENPTYEQVSSGGTGHAEAIEITYDPNEVSYEKLLDVFWSNIDPTVKNRQFADGGTQYRTAIFYHDDEQRQIAEASKAALGQTAEFKGKPIVTEIVPAGAYYAAEDYHQQYYQKNSAQFHAYERGSGRAGYVERREKMKAATAGAKP